LDGDRENNAIFYRDESRKHIGVDHSSSVRSSLDNGGVTKPTTCWLGFPCLPGTIAATLKFPKHWVAAISMNSKTSMVSLNVRKVHRPPAISPSGIANGPLTWWGDWYTGWQGELLIGSGESLSGAQAINQVLPTLDFPVQVGFDNYPGNTNIEYLEQINQAAIDDISWLWWAWQGDGVDSHV
jgi:hypothetical protein